MNEELIKSESIEGTGNVILSYPEFLKWNVRRPIYNGTLKPLSNQLIKWRFIYKSKFANFYSGENEGNFLTKPRFKMKKR